MGSDLNRLTELLEGLRFFGHVATSLEEYAFLDPEVRRAYVALDSRSLLKLNSLGGVDVALHGTRNDSTCSLHLSFDETGLPNYDRISGGK